MSWKFISSLGCTLLFTTNIAWSQPAAGGSNSVLKVSTPEIITAARIPDRQPHPLLPAIRLAIDEYKYIRDEIRDYSCVMVRRERTDGRLGDHEYIFAKVRHRRKQNDQTVVPFSVYLKFLKPTEVAGREVLYVEGQNDGEMLVRKGGPRFGFVTTRLKPESDVAMTGNRYPITEFGFENLVRRLIQVSKEDLKTDCRVEFFEDAKINGRNCLGIEVTHPETSLDTRFHVARIFLDRELNVPIHYEAYGWPSEQKQDQPVLLEQYTYTKIQLNNGFDDADFSPDNPEYGVK